MKNLDRRVFFEINVILDSERIMNIGLYESVSDILAIVYSLDSEIDRANVVEYILVVHDKSKVCLGNGGFVYDGKCFYYSKLMEFSELFLAFKNDVFRMVKNCLDSKFSLSEIVEDEILGQMEDMNKLERIAFFACIFISDLCPFR